MDQDAGLGGRADPAMTLSPALLLDGLLAVSAGVAIWLWVRLCQELRAARTWRERMKEKEGRI